MPRAGAAPSDSPNQLLRQTLADADSPESFAKAYQRLFLDTVGRLATDRVICSAHAVDHARLVNWMTGHAALFGATLPVEEARSFLAQQAKIAARIQRESRLCVAMSDGSAENDYVFIRGSHKAHGETVPRRFLEALTGSTALRSPSW